MVESYHRQDALAHRALDARSPAIAGLELSLHPPAAQLCLRGGGRPFAAAVKKVLGVAPPTRANTVAVHGSTRILWLGPDEWLAVGAGGDGSTLCAALESALGAQHALVTDVSHARVIVVLRGEHAREVLMKGCGLDLDATVFGPGRCAQSALARGHMLLHLVEDPPPCFHVYAQRSFADYVYAWLEDASVEYRALGTEPPPVRGGS